MSEELLAREAREMGLDRNDTIVRRRLAQKLKFLVEDTSGLIEPKEAELRQFYETNAARFRAGRGCLSRKSSSTRRCARTPSRMRRRRLAELQASGDTDPAATVGDRLLFDAEIRDADEQAVSSMFGPEFARAVFALSPGRWSEPVKSGYGLHLVSIAYTSAAKHPL